MKKFWTKLHTILGITAGTVLCVVGVTGAMQSFEEDLLHSLNPDVFKVTSVPGGVLPLHELFARAQSARPEQRIASWQMHSAAGHPIRVGFAAAGRQQQPAADPKGQKPAEKPRTEFRYLNTSNGELHPPLRGEEFFRVVNQIHRKLVAGEVGKQIVGASVMGLVILCLSGLYLRWPQNPLSVRAWFKLDFKQKGRRFLRDLHMISGTCLLLLYLFSALTGLYWSYEWYKNGLYTLSGTTPPVREVKLEKAAQANADVERMWAIFLQASNGQFHDATLRFPEKTEHALEIRYLAADYPHDRAFNRLFLHPDSGAVIEHERYAEKSAGGKLIAGIYPLHTGSFFGLPGILILMISSLAMPLFGITGWKMYLDRHRREDKAAKAAAKMAIGRRKIGSMESAE
jgi:sulfite reductase (NADPH) flavoprotein alpha-component